MNTFAKYILNEVKSYYQGFINEETDELAVRHASGAMFDKFDSSYINTGCGCQSYGWGWYVSTDPDVHNGYAKSYQRQRNWIEGTTKVGAIEYDIEIPDDNGHNYIAWDGPADQVDWSKLGIKPEGRTFGQVYDNVIGKDGQKAKELSLALSDLGYTGIKIAHRRNSGNTSMDMPNYVVFRDDDMQITNKKISDSATDLKFDENGLAVVNKYIDGVKKYNVVDSKCNPLWSNWYYYIIVPLGDGTYKVSQQDENGNMICNLADSKGNELWSNWYYAIDPLGDGTYKVGKGKKDNNGYPFYTLADSKGNPIWSNSYNDIKPLGDGTYEVLIIDENDNWLRTLVDSQGNPLWPNWYNSIEPLNNGTYEVYKYDENGNRIYNLVDRQGNELWSNWYGYIKPLRDGTYQVYKYDENGNEMYNFVDRNGNPIQDNANNVREGLIRRIIKQVINEDTDELASRHASGAMFDKFDNNYVNTGCGSQYYGWGWYVSTDPEVHQGYVDSYNADGNWIPGTTKLGAVEYDVEIPDDNGHNYIAWDGPADQVDWSKFESKVDKSCLIADTTYYTFGDVYELIVNRSPLTPKDVSLYLNELGYIGIKISAYHNSGNREMDMPNYVIFRDEDMQITNKKISDDAKDLEFDENGLAIAYKNIDGEKRYNLIDCNGNPICPNWYNDIEQLGDGIYQVRKNDENGNWICNFVDSKGNELWPNWYIDIESLGDGTYEVSKKDENGDWIYNFVDRQGNELFPNWYYDIYPLGDGNYRVGDEYDENDNLLYTLADRQGNPLWDNWYNKIEPLGEGTYKVGKLDENDNWLCTLADRQGNPLWDNWYNKIEPLGEGTYKVGGKYENGRQVYAIVDRNGNPIQDNANNVREGLISRIIKQVINEETDELAAKHATSAWFDKFDSKYMSTGCGSQFYGWGWYVSTDPKVHQGYVDNYNGDYRWIEGTTKRGAVEMDVEIPDDNGTNYISWDGPADQVDWSKLGITPEGNTFGKAYNNVTHRDRQKAKELSLALSELGYTGIKVAHRRNSGNRDMDMPNYVVFRDEDMQITNKKISDDAKDLVFDKNGLAIVGKNIDGKNKYNFVDCNGNPICPNWYNDIYPLEYGTYKVVDYDENHNRVYALINRQGNELWSNWYTEISPNGDGTYQVCKRDEKGRLVYNFTDSHGNPIWPNWYIDIESLGDGTYKVSKKDEKGNDIYNFVDRQGNELCSNWYNEIKSNYDGTYTVGKMDENGNEIYNFVDSQGNVLWPNWYDYIGSYVGGTYNVYNHDENGYWICNLVDSEGNELFPNWYHDIQPNRNGTYTVGKIDENDNLLYTLADRQGNPLWPNWYNDIKPLRDGTYKVCKYDEEGNLSHNFVDSEGNIIQDNANNVREGLIRRIIKQVINEETDELAARHATNAWFDKFDNKYVNTGCKSQSFGWGWYVSTDPEVHKGYVGYYNDVGNWIEGTTKNGAVEIDVEIPDDDGHNYIAWDGPADQVDWSKLGITPNNDTFGEVYKSVTHGDKQKAKELSLALSNLGYVGIKVANRRNSGNTSMDMPNYVIFRDDDMQITNKKISDDAKDLEFDENGRAMVYKTDDYGYTICNYADSNGNALWDDWYNNIWPLGDGTYKVRKNAENGNIICNFVGSNGKALWPDWYNYIEPLSNGTYMVIKIDEKGNMFYNLVDNHGNPLWSNWYNYIDPLGNGTYKVGKRDANGKRIYNYADSQGNLILNNWYNYIESFGDGTYRVRKCDENGNCVYTIVDRNGNIVQDK